MSTEDIEQSAQWRTLTRKEYREMLERKRKRRDKRRRRRVRRLRAYQSLRSLQFWMRVLMIVAIGLCIAFWARFAFVYDIPSYAEAALPGHIRAYVTVKPWWFGPPVFDIRHYAATGGLYTYVSNPTTYLYYKLGHYAAVLQHPQFVWVLQNG